MATVRQQRLQTQVLDQYSGRRHTVSNLAYADDLAAMTNSIADMKVQAQRMQVFVAWSGMTVNCKKYAITGML